MLKKAPVMWRNKLQVAIYGKLTDVNMIEALKAIGLTKEGLLEPDEPDTQ